MQPTHQGTHRDDTDERDHPHQTRADIRTVSRRWGVTGRHWQLSTLPRPCSGRRLVCVPLGRSDGSARGTVGRLIPEKCDPERQRRGDRRRCADAQLAGRRGTAHGSGRADPSVANMADRLVIEVNGLQVNQIYLRTKDIQTIAHRLVSIAGMDPRPPCIMDDPDLSMLGGDKAKIATSLQRALAETQLSKFGKRENPEITSTNLFRQNGGPMAFHLERVLWAIKNDCSNADRFMRIERQRLVKFFTWLWLLSAQRK
jgi:hypothetical protein